MSTKMKDHIFEDNEELGKVYRDTMEGQFEHDLKNKCFSNQLESDETDSLQQRFDCWMMVFDREGPISNNVYKSSFVELFGLYRKASDPELQEMTKLLRDRQIIPQE